MEYFLVTSYVVLHHALSRLFYLFQIYTCVLLINFFYGMPNIFLKVTVEKKWRTQNFDFLSLKGSSPGHWIYKLFVVTEKSEGWERNCVWLYIFYFERNYDVLKSKSPCFLLKKNLKFNKNKKESKIENPWHSFREMNHMLQLYFYPKDIFLTFVFYLIYII